MKKIFNSILVIAAAAAVFASCQKNEVVPSTTKTVNFTATTVDTKAAFGTPDGTSYPTLWTSNDSKVKVSLNYATPVDADVTPASDGKSATFSGEFTDDKSNDYLFTAISPKSAAVSTSAQYKSWTVEIPTTQTPSATSVDEAAMILSAATATTDMTKPIELAFQHVTAYGVFNLTNLNLAGAVISSVTLTAEKPIAGRFFNYPANGDIEVNSGVNSITINTSSTENIWFACAPCELGGTTLKVVVNTDKGTFTKNATIPANKFKFEAGVIGKFNIDMTGIKLVSSKVYTKVTDIDELTVGSKVIIVASSEDLALSTTQNSNNRGTAGVTRSDNKILDPSESVQILTLEKGEVSKTVAFYTGSGYLYAASASSNHLKTQGTLDKNGSFAVEFIDGNADLKAQGTNTRNWLRFNSESGLFSCYSATSEQGDVQLYKLEGSGTEELIIVEPTYYNITIAEASHGTVEASKVKAEAGETITVTVTPDSGYILGSLKCDDEDITSEQSFNMPSHDVTITAVFEAMSSGMTKEYVATITYEDIENLTGGSSTAYASYNGKHSVTAVADDRSKKDMTFESYQVMPGISDNAGKMQFQAKNGKISGNGWGMITSISAPSALSVTYNGGNFTISKDTTGAGYYDSITIVFSY